MFVLLLFADKKSRAASQGSCKVIRAIRVMGKCTHLLSLWLCGHSVLPLCFIIRDNPFNVHLISQKREKTPESLPPAAWRTQPFVCTVPLRGFFMNYWSQTKECEWREKGRKGEGRVCKGFISWLSGNISLFGYLYMLGSTCKCVLTIPSCSLWRLWLHECS